MLIANRNLLCALLLTVGGLSPLAAAERYLRLATTTSTENSGLLQQLNPPFETLHGIKLQVIAVGTGKALRLGENGDVDVLFVHAPEAEKKFIAAGYGIQRRPVMHNDFLIIGPATDPAGISASPNAAGALERIAGMKSVFVSRGDESGTHKKEKQLWQAAGIEPRGIWYLATGQGMGAVLQIAADKNAYTLTDRGTYIAYRTKIQLHILHQGDPRLVNPYHVIAVNPARHPHVSFGPAKKYIDYLGSARGQKIINDFRLGDRQLFYPDVIKQP